MKNLRTTLLSLSVIVVSLMFGTAKADNIDLQTAKEVGAYYFSVATGAKAPITADKLKLVEQMDNPTLCIPALYSFNISGNGFVIVSASNCVEPVLAYSPVGSLDPENVNPACRAMLNSYVEIISVLQNEEAAQTATYKQRWDELLNHTFTCNPESKAILIQTKWGQDYPYNTFCPVIRDTVCPTGCVATAMASIIRYWQYPLKGAGTAATSWRNQTLRYYFTHDSNKFIYDSMPLRPARYNCEWNIRRALGKLMYACGVTVRMGWDIGGSGTQSTYVPNALTTYFRYSSDAKHITRGSYTDAQWDKMLHSELDDNRRPIYYSAFDPTSSGADAGHAFVIAGSSSSDEHKYYIRWGWDGNSDGFFTLTPASQIERAGGYKFYDRHAMVYKIHPKTEGIEDNTSYSIAPSYPNPATDYMMIPSDLPLNAYLTIYSMDGKIVDRHIIPGGAKEYRLDLQNYAPGMYVYRLNGNAYKFTVQ